MSNETLPALRPARAPWNKGRIVGQKRPLLPKHFWSICVRPEMADNRCDLALFNMAIDCMLRGCDVVCLRVNEVFAAGRVKERASVTQLKTRKPVRFEITETTRLALERWIKDPEMIGCEYLWPSRLHASPHLSTRQYARIMRDWVLFIGLEPSAQANNVKSLKGREGIRLWVGDWRVIMGDQGNVLAVLDVGPRGGIYDCKGMT